MSGCSRRTWSCARITIASNRGGGSAAQRNWSGNGEMVHATGVGVGTGVGAGVGVATAVGPDGASSQPQQPEWKRAAHNASARAAGNRFIGTPDPERRQAAGRQMKPAGEQA